MSTESKRELRERMTAARDAIPPKERAARSERLARHAIAAWEAGAFAWGAPPDGERPRRLAWYAAFRSEADAAGLARWCWARGIPVAAPRVDAAAKAMTLHDVAGEQELMPGTYGILEPAPHAPLAALTPGTLTLVPGLAFDARGGRLGYGGGYYDRLLAPHRAAIDAGAILLAAPAFAAQIVDVVPTEPHDVRVRFLLTEEGIIDCKTGGAYQWS
ncbi:5-formyltetrahydrofolate cyclo-ligase [Paenibacillus antri]|nr:5-formyltetrahydrofolate cyclo-ligase [Paenibacillus antri]